MKSEDDIKHCKTDGIPNEVIMKTEAQSKKKSNPNITKKEAEE